MAKPADRMFGRRHRWALAAAVALLAAASGCNASRQFKHRASMAFNKVLRSNYDDPMAESKLQEAEELFTAQQYEKALPIFRTLADNQGNSAVLAERARFMQGECRFMIGQYPEAADTYYKVLADFADSGAYRRDCSARIYQICDYWLDDFRDDLDKRVAKGEAGILRWRPHMPRPLDRTRPAVDQEGRALEALQRVHVHDPNGPFADKALFWCGYVNFIRGNFSEADQFFSELENQYKDSPLRPQAIALAIQAKNNATGGAAYDGRKCAEALQLVHIAEASVPELTNNPDMAEKLTRAKFAIRSQQAEKDFLMADYYQRTGHPGPAVFYYELVRRRYAGTQYAKTATERQARLVSLMQQGHPDPGSDPFAVAKAKINEWVGRNKAVEEKDRPRADPNLTPAGGSQPAPAMPTASGSRQ